MQIYNPPSELQKATPRTTKIRKNFVLRLLLQSSILIVFLVMGAGITLMDVHKEFLQSHGVVTQGTVMNSYIKHISGRHSHDEYHVRYYYSPPELGAGMVLHEDHTFNYNAYQNFKPGQVLEVKYDPQNPESSLAQGEPVYTFTDFIFLPILAIFMWIMFYDIRNYYREKYLLTYGKATVGTLKTEKRVSTRSGTYATFTYEFTDAMGIVQTGKQRAIPALGVDNELPLRGEFVVIKQNTTVLYDPNDSCRNVLYPSIRLQLV